MGTCNTISILGLLLVLGLMRCSTALGINCQGSSQCSPFYNTINTDNLISRFNRTIWTTIRDDARFSKDRQIACAKNAHWAVGGICLFLQGHIPIAGIPGTILKYRISDLLYHGCRYCGSVPISGDNNATKAGFLTSNYVVDPWCDGLCDVGNTFSTVTAIPTSTPISLNFYWD